MLYHLIPRIEDVIYEYKMAASNWSNKNRNSGNSGWHFIILYRLSASMTEMALSTLLPPTHNINTPLKKSRNISTVIIHIELPAPLNKALQLREKPLDWVQIRWIGREINWLHPCIKTNLFDSSNVTIQSNSLSLKKWNIFKFHTTIQCSNYP